MSAVGSSIRGRRGIRRGVVVRENHRRFAGSTEIRTPKRIGYLESLESLESMKTGEGYRVGFEVCFSVR